MYLTSLGMKRRTKIKTTAATIKLAYLFQIGVNEMLIEQKKYPCEAGCLRIFDQKQYQ